MKLGTKVKSRVISYLASESHRSMKHRIGKLKRTGLPTVHYFHQVDDPYSHLAVQRLDALRNRYRVLFEHHLVGPPPTDAQGDSDRFKPWAVRDARSIASYYGVALPNTIDSPTQEEVDKANANLADKLKHPGFADEAIAIGNQLWTGSPIKSGAGDLSAVQEGDRLREKLGHYLSATFYFEGEWYWGVDRLLHLEDRLCNMGLSNNPASICVARPEPKPLGQRDASDITVEYFPSLRSPYTAISIDRTLALVARTGAQLKLRPVMPMVMRGVPLHRFKGLYILQDTKREADYYKEPFGHIVDPIGDPVKRAFSLLPFMISVGKDVRYCREYLKASWTEGVDITTDDGLRQVVERCDVNWQDAVSYDGNADWQSILDHNVKDMLDAGLWGVPSFRVSGGLREEPFCCWGQDRLWRVETEIVERAH